MNKYRRNINPKCARFDVSILLGRDAVTLG